MQSPQVSYRFGVVGPTAGGVDRGPLFQSLLPPDVVQLSNGIGISDYTVDGVEEAMARYRGCIDALVQQGAQRTFLAGFPISAQLGRARALKLFQETQERTGLPASSDAEATIESIKHLGVTRVTIASRWAKELNDKLVQYLTEGGIEVLYITSAGQWAKEAFAMSIEQGVKIAFQLGREAMRNAPQAQGLLMPGGTWRILAAIPILEDDFDKPVFSNPTALPWRLMHDGVAPPLQGWGRLLEKP